MEVVGAAASIVSLVQAANEILEIVRHLQCNQQRKQRLQQMVDGLIQKLQEAESVSDSNFTLSELEKLKDMFESLEKRPCPQCPARLTDCFWSCVTGPRVYAKLEEAERKLDSLRAQVLVTVVASRQPIICNDRVELPPSQVGLDRAQAALEFLEQSQGEELRVIGIHGQPGVGKTTLVHVLWEEASSKAPFTKRAYVQVGNDVSESSLCNLQSDILEQLGGEKKVFSSVDFGKGGLSHHFQELKKNQKPMFLVIDNLWEAEHLEKLLPQRLSKEFLPTSSCIIVSCRDVGVVKALLRVCHLQEHNGPQSFLFTPPLLSDQDSKALFVEMASMDVAAAADHEELLNALVPLCAGLPFALTILAKNFLTESKRVRGEWEAVVKQIKDVEGDDDQETFGPIKKTLNLSFQRLSQACKAGFLDLVSFFYGWPWDRVERIVGANVLKHLQNIALISEADKTQCNQSELKQGHSDKGNFYYFQSTPSKKVVAMHDLSLAFGKRLDVHYFFQKDINKECENVEELENCYGLEATRCRNLALTRADKHAVGPYLEFLKGATNLQMLILQSSKDRSSTLLQAGYNRFESAKPLPPSHGRRLRHLRLEYWNSSNPVMEMMLSSEIREIYLFGCDDIVHLPDIPFQKLEKLEIEKCRNFQGFSKSCLKWCCLKELAVVRCNSFTEIPAELGRLPNLNAVAFMDCGGLEEFPSLCSRNGPYHVRLENCPKLDTLPYMSCPLQTLKLDGVPISGLDIEWVFLQELLLSDCALEVLPLSIANATLLQVLELSGCAQLKQLPDEIGKLKSLRVLRLTRCRNLERLPPAIGNALSLKELEVRECGDMLEVPPEVGKLTSLTRLISCNGPAVDVAHLGSLRECTFLKKLPAKGVSELLQLEDLSIEDCNDQLEVLEELGNLTSLRVLLLSNCRGLRELPAALCNACNLGKLELRNCKSLKKLPESICNMSSLYWLILHGCESILELPKELGSLTSLTQLDLGNCKGLEKVPESICKISSLQKLSLNGCESIVELPKELGSLTSLIELYLGNCKGLEKVPESICRISSLQRLSLYGCESIVELPKELGSLTSLTELNLGNCKGLEKLPESICRISSLQKLSLPKELGRKLQEAAGVHLPELILEG